MELTLEIPDEIAACLAGPGRALSRTALEALAVEGYRGGALTTKQVRLLLGHLSRWETEDFLSAHGAGHHRRRGCRKQPQIDRTAAPMIVISENILAQAGTRGWLDYHLEIARLRQETNFRVTNAVVLAAWEEAAAAE